MIDPRDMTVTQWTDFMATQLLGLVQPPRLDDPQAWRVWALMVNQSARIAAFNPPNPYAFDDWRIWAERFNQTVPLLT